MLKKAGYRNWFLGLFTLFNLSAAFILWSCTSTEPKVVKKNPIKVAIIDTGLRVNLVSVGVKLCNTNEHYDFYEDRRGIGYDTQGHGTNVVETIIKFAGDAKYCFLIFKVFDDSIDSPSATAENIAKALEMARTAGAKVYNLSLNGFGSGFNDRGEHAAMIRSGMKADRIFVAAGNNNANLNDGCYSFPACYSGIDNKFVVGSKKSLTSLIKNKTNYGHVVDMKEDFCYGDFCGTSASTAIATGKYLKGLE